MKKLIATLLIGIGLAGSVLFLPQNIQSGHTCFFNQLWSPNHAAPGNFETGSGHQHPSTHLIDPHFRDEQEMLANYLVPYAFFWWTSLLMLGLGAGFVYVEWKQATREANFKHKHF